MLARSQGISPSALTDPRPQSLGLGLDLTRHQSRTDHLKNLLRKYLTLQLISNNNLQRNKKIKTDSD